MSRAYLHPLTVPTHPTLGERPIVIAAPESTGAEGLAMARNVLKACDLDSSVHATELLIGEGVALAPRVADTAVRYVVSYGLSPKQLGAQWQVVPYTWLRDAGVLWCFAERLETINDDVARKKQLWACLKDLKQLAEVV